MEAAAVPRRPAASRAASADSTATIARGWSVVSLPSRDCSSRAARASAPPSALHPAPLPIPECAGSQRRADRTPPRAATAARRGAPSTARCARGAPCRRAAAAWSLAAAWGGEALATCVPPAVDCLTSCDAWTLARAAQRRRLCLAFRGAASGSARRRRPRSSRSGRGLTARRRKQRWQQTRRQARRSCAASWRPAAARARVRRGQRGAASCQAAPGCPLPSGSVPYSCGHPACRGLGVSETRTTRRTAGGRRLAL